ncbi:MAG: transcriptional regulator MraZ [Patescibacteria group bacterium]|nr:transcriptional regulator MraZ [Patescibacteria group bacterium]
MAKVDYFARKLDDKNRLTLPAEVRDEFAEGIVITRGFGTYLHAYPKEVWQQDVESRLKGDILDERIADLNVRFRMGKKDVVPDGKQGRITLDSSLLSFAEIQQDVVAIRVGQYWRLGSPKNINS